MILARLVNTIGLDGFDYIGYDGLGYVPPDIKKLAIARKPGEPYILPSAVTVNDNSYPIARDLYMYVSGQPTGFVKNYLEWILSPQAQEIVTELGFVPLKVKQ